RVAAKRIAGQIPYRVGVVVSREVALRLTKPAEGRRSEILCVLRGLRRAAATEILECLEECKAVRRVIALVVIDMQPVYHGLQCAPVAAVHVAHCISHVRAYWRACAGTRFAERHETHIDVGI